MKKNILYAGVCFMLMVIPALAQEAQPQTGVSFPQTLWINGSPIHPICFRGVSAAGQDIDMNTCAQRTDITVHPGGIYQPETGFIGVSFKSLAPGGKAGFIEYKYLGQTGASHAVLVEEGVSGGSAISTLYQLTRTGDTLHVDNVTRGGDGCKDGIINSTAADGALHYAVYKTASGLYRLGKAEAGISKEALALDDCPTCCYGAAQYNNGKLEAVFLNKAVLQAAAAGNVELSPAQECFIDVFADRLQSGETLAPEALAAFAGDVDENCFSSEVDAAPETPEQQGVPRPPE